VLRKKKKINIMLLTEQKKKKKEEEEDDDLLNTESSPGISPQFFHCLLVIEQKQKSRTTEHGGKLGFRLIKPMCFFWA
jgi:hypothetical protein